MAKECKWRVGVSTSEFFVVEVEALTEELAIEKAFFEVDYFPDDHVTGISKAVTSVLINDRESRGFAPYVQEGISEKSEIGDFE